MFRFPTLTVLVFLSVCVNAADGQPAQPALNWRDPPPAWQDDSGMPPRASARLGRPRAVLSVFNFSPDGKLLLVSDQRGFAVGQSPGVQMVEVETGKLVRTFTGASVGILCANFAPDGKLVVAGGMDDRLRLWDADTGKLRCEPIVHQGHVYAVSFSPDGKHFVTGSNQLRVFETATARAVKMLVPPPTGRGTEFMFHALWSPDGHTIVSGSETGIRLWSFPAGEQQAFIRRTASLHTNRLGFAAGGKELLLGAWPVARWERYDATGKLLFAAPKEATVPTRVTFSGNGRTLVWPADSHAGGHDASELVVEAVSGAGQPRRLPIAQKAYTFAVSFDGQRVAVGDNQGGLELWDAEKAQKLHPLLTPSPPIAALHWNANGDRLLALTSARTLHEWDLQKSRELRRCDFPIPSAQMLVGRSPTGKIIAAADAKGTLTLWETATGKAWPQPEQALALRPARQASGANLGFPFQPPPRLGGPVEPLATGDIAFSQDGQLAALVGGPEQNTSALVWEVATGKVRRLFEKLSHPNGAALSPDGKTLWLGAWPATGPNGSDPGVTGHDVESGKAGVTLKLPKPAANQRTQVSETPRGLYPSPDGKRLAVMVERVTTNYPPPGAPGRPSMFQGWHVHILNVSGVVESSHPCSLGSPVAWSSDGKLTAWSHEGIVLLDVAAGKTHVAPGSAATVLSFNPAGPELATGGSDGAILVWDVNRLRKGGK